MGEGLPEGLSPSGRGAVSGQSAQSKGLRDKG